LTPGAPRAGIARIVSGAAVLGQILDFLLGAELAFAAGVVAKRALRAARAFLFVIDCVERAVGRRVNVDGFAIVGAHRATAEAVATVRRACPTELDARLGHLARGVVLVELSVEAIGVIAAAVVAGAGVAVEEAVLPLGIFVVAGDPGR